MLHKKLELLFLGIVFVSLATLGYSLYTDYSFKHNPLPKATIQKIKAKEQEVLNNMQKNLGIRYKFPLIITDKIPGRLYGLTSYDNGKITIYLNKKVMKESLEYVLSDVIAHEYAHALLFRLGYNEQEHEGHSKRWQKTCQLLGGKDCRQYVNQKEIIMSKLPFH